MAVAATVLSSCRGRPGTRRVHHLSVLVSLAALAAFGLHQWKRRLRCLRRALEPDELLDMFASSEAVAGSGLRLPGWMTWGASVVLGGDGLYHMFFSRWPEQLGHNAWVTNSEVAHAVAGSPLGPWRVRGVALPRRGARFWDGQGTHNPTVHWHAQRREYVLFYIGTTYDDAPPRRGQPFANRTYAVAARRTLDQRRMRLGRVRFTRPSPIVAQPVRDGEP